MRSSRPYIVKRLLADYRALYVAKHLVNSASLREGLGGVAAPSEDELDMLDRAGIATPDARLACQVSGPVTWWLTFPATIRQFTAVITPVSVTAAAAKHFTSQLAQHSGAIGVRSPSSSEVLRALLTESIPQGSSA